MIRSRGQKPLRERVLAALADGEFHSGEALAERLRVSRTAVWKAVNALERIGIEVHAVPKRGYRLPVSVELLDADAIRRALAPDTRARLRQLDVELLVDSTNSRLLESQDLPTGRADASLAEIQSAGRGRRGREWLAPFGAGLCLSVSWQFPEVPRQLSALSLAIGVGVLRALGALGVRDLGLKWPNDLLAGRNKLGGILIELRAESGGPAFVVVGIGINVRLDPRTRRALAAQGVAVADLAGIASAPPGRNRVAAAILDRTIEALIEFERSGLETFLGEWAAADALAAAPARVAYGDKTFQGIARGIDSDGALLLEVPGQLLRFTSGEVTLRAEAAP